MKFNTIHSLGSRCQNSEILRYFGYREFSGFFDFMNTSIFSNLYHIIKDDFNELLKDENNVSLTCNQLTFDPETGNPLHSSIRTSNKFYESDYTNINKCIFPHHDLNSEKDKRHFIKCKERFKKLGNFNTLFNYTYNTWENFPTISDLIGLVDVLKTVHNFENFKVCFIGVFKTNNSQYQKIFESEFFDIWNIHIAENSFTGGLFNVEKDNQNYIDIIKHYDIDVQRITKEEIDSI